MVEAGEGRPAKWMDMEAAVIHTTRSVPEMGMGMDTRALLHEDDKMGT